MDDLRKGCPMRHENGNCTVIGGFCTAVNDPICEGLHNAYDNGYRDAAIRAMSDEELCNWLFQRDCTNIAAFLEHGGMGVMNAVQLLDWLQQPPK